ncbi:hypothetical protein [Aliihoeflea sp. PC F10.4]
MLHENKNAGETGNPTQELFLARSRELSLLDDILEEVLFRTLPDETPAAGLKQIAIITLFYSLKTKGIPLSLTTLTEMTGMTRKSAQEGV